MQSSAPTAPSASWGVREVIGGIVIFAMPLILLFAGLRVANLGQLEIPSEWRPLINAGGLLVFEALLIVPVWLMAVVKARGSWQALGFRAFDRAMGCALPVGYLFAAYTLSFIWGLVLFVTGWPTQPRIAPIFGDNVLAIVLGFIAAAIVAPIAEETFFRGFMLNGLRRRFGNVGALLISAAFFGLLHQPISIFPVIFALGILLGLLLLQTDSLWPGIFMHTAFNTIGFVAQFLLSR